MNRRGFLGSVIGLYVGTLVPFRALPIPFAEKPLQYPKLEAYKRCIRLFEIPRSLLLQCHLFAENEEGVQFLAPRMDAVERDLDNLVLFFKARPILMQSTVKITKIGILDDMKRFVKLEQPSCVIDMVCGDQLIVHYTLSLGGV